MKRLLLVVGALCAFTWGHAQNIPTVEIDNSGAQSVEATVQAAFEHVDLSAVPTGMLLEYGYSSIDPDPYLGVPNSAHAALTPTHWRQLYAGMARGVLPQAAPLASYYLICDGPTI